MNTLLLVGHESLRFNLMIIAIALLLCGAAFSEVTAYECDSFPEEEGWGRINFTEISRTIDDSYFVQILNSPGVVDAYQQPLSFFEGASFFIEWAVETDAPSSILDSSGTPTAVSAGGPNASNYHFTITDRRVRFFRDSLIPLVYAELEPSTSHCYRLELCPSEDCTQEHYSWYVNGVLLDSGIAEGSYPNSGSVLVWGSRHQGFDSTTRWNYVRLGIIPAQGSGDFNSDAAVSQEDYFYFHECMERTASGEPATPSCAWADYNADDTVDMLDFRQLQAAFTGPP